MVLQTDGHWFLVESRRVLRTVGSDHVTGDPALPVRGAEWTRAPGAQPLFIVSDQIKECPEIVFEQIQPWLG